MSGISFQSPALSEKGTKNSMSYNTLVFDQISF